MKRRFLTNDERIWVLKALGLGSLPLHITESFQGEVLSESFFEGCERKLDGQKTSCLGVLFKNSDFELPILSLSSEGPLWMQLLPSPWRELGGLFLGDATVEVTDPVWKTSLDDLWSAFSEWEFSLLDWPRVYLYWKDRPEGTVVLHHARGQRSRVEWVKGLDLLDRTDPRSEAWLELKTPSLVKTPADLARLAETLRQSSGQMASPTVSANQVRPETLL